MYLSSNLFILENDGFFSNFLMICLNEFCFRSPVRADFRKEEKTSLL